MNHRKKFIEAIVIVHVVILKIFQFWGQPLNRRRIMVVIGYWTFGGLIFELLQKLEPESALQRKMV